MHAFRIEAELLDGLHIKFIGEAFSVVQSLSSFYFYVHLIHFFLLLSFQWIIILFSTVDCFRFSPKSKIWLYFLKVRLKSKSKCTFLCPSEFHSAE